MSRAGFAGAVVLSLLVAQTSFAELYQYTDNNGVLHFTDDPSKVPAKSRREGKAEPATTLSNKESKTLKFMMDADKTPDVPVDDLKEVKKSLSKFADGLKEGYDDPEQQLDPRLSTPEAALAFYRAALRSGNLNDVKAAVSSRYWQGYGDALQTMSRAQLAEFADLVTNGTVRKKEQNAQIAVFEIVRTDGTFTFEFINLFGNWRFYR